MVISQEIVEIKSQFEYHMRDLQESDAEELAKIFKIVYNGQYPLKEYENPDWIKKQVDNPNVIWKVCADESGRPVGCGVMLLDPIHGRLYGGRTVLLPELQGKGIMNKIGMEPIKQVMNDYRDKIRIFYGQSRTEPNNIAMQRTLEKLDFRPLALMVDMDTGLGDRESEVVQALLFQSAYHRKKDVKIIPDVEPFYNVSRKQFPRIGKDYEVVEPASIDKKECNLSFYYKEGKFRDVFEIENTIAAVSAEINRYTNSLEITKYTKGHPELLALFLEEIIKFCDKKGILFIEAYASAYDPSEQQAFLDAGFKIAGYFPSYEVVDGVGEDRVVMLRSPASILTTGFEFTKKCWKVAKEVINHLNMKGEVKTTDRGNFQFYPQ